MICVGARTTRPLHRSVLLWESFRTNYGLGLVVAFALHFRQGLASNLHYVGWATVGITNVSIAFIAA
jgi:hypothetical protein